IIQNSTSPNMGTLTINGTSYKQKETLLMMSGKGGDIKNVETIFAGYGMQEDYEGLDVKGKVVFVMGGLSDDKSRQATAAAMPIKKAIAEEKGAAALIEIYNLSFPWNFFLRYFGRSQRGFGSGSDVGNSIPYGWIQPSTENDDLKNIRKGKEVKVDLQVTAGKISSIESQNVVGILEGTDPELKNEYLLISAHYDHVGVGKQGGGAFTEQDSIFNGARDNGIGTVTLMATARALAKNPPKRSVIFFACTAEEIGLLGSRYYADNPMIPLEQTIFDLNIDGAGYNDKSLVTVFGYDRTGVAELADASAEQYGLKVLADPAPEQNLFDRSDNVSFAAKGVPAMTFSMGFTTFDAEIRKYYHQVTDNPDSVDYAYCEQYARAFATLAKKIANMGGKPTWIAGDKYEAVGKALYGEKK
ncbi:MAG: M28 family peptidase, partial [Bacteroidota bacterium]